MCQSRLFSFGIFTCLPLHRTYLQKGRRVSLCLKQLPRAVSGRCRPFSPSLTSCMCAGTGYYYPPASYLFRNTRRPVDWACDPSLPTSFNVLIAQLRDQWKNRVPSKARFDFLCSPFLPSHCRPPSQLAVRFQFCGKASGTCRPNLKSLFPNAKTLKYFFPSL